MKIINRVMLDNYSQWISKFVENVISSAKLQWDEVIIENSEEDKRIYLIIDREEYTVRTWNFHVVNYNSDGIPCAEMIDYTLFKTVDCADGSYGEEVDSGTLRIEWKN